MKEVKILIIGANGQLGTALKEQYPDAICTDVNELDITNKQSVHNFDWDKVEYILNAAAYTNVDGAETKEGRVTAWKVNAVAVRNLVEVANQHNITLVHISTDYVFDGSRGNHKEDEPLTPLSAYGASKASGDIVCSLAKKHYILRTSWVIGEGNNFVRTMLELAKKGVEPKVVSDQIGRLTFTSEIVRAIDYLLVKKCKYGIYNITNSGEPSSWAEVAKEVFRLALFDNRVYEVTTPEYYKDKEGIAYRPLNSILDLSKLNSTGFKSIDWITDLEKYIKKEISK